MITVYSTKNCSYCPLVKRYLDAKNVPYQVVDVTDDPTERERLRIQTGYQTVPVTYNDETEGYVVGWRVAQLAELIS